ncbi:MAG: serine hydrolase domain-containing protein [Bacillota bacterium]
MREAVDQEMAKTRFSGVVLVEHDGAPVIREARGHANRSDLIPNEMGTRFGIASGGKISTAVSIYQLIEQGILRLGATIGEILDIPLGRIDPAVTVAQLLTHTSGIPDYFDEENMDDYSSIWDEKPVYTLRSPKDFLPLFSAKEMCFHPGDRFKYSNSGFVVLGMVLESVTGRPPESRHG